MKKLQDIKANVEFSEPVGFFKFMDLEEYLQILSGVKVDLVSKKALKPRIGRQILREVIYIWRTEYIWIMFRISLAPSGI